MHGLFWAQGVGLLKFLVMIIMCIIFISVPLKLSSDVELTIDNIYSDLQEYRDGLKNYIEILEEEIRGKEAELASIDSELVDLESQYNKLLDENKKISDKLNSLNAAKDH